MTAIDNFGHSPIRLDSPGIHVETVTPSDTVELVVVCRSLFVGGAGTVAVVAVDGSTATFTVGAGQSIECEIRQVKATGTTATLMVALS